VAYADDRDFRALFDDCSPTKRARGKNRAGSLLAWQETGRSKVALPRGVRRDSAHAASVSGTLPLEIGCKVFVIDELDRSLHPLLVHSILKFFVNAYPGACQQLIVTSHETHLLDQDLLRRDEIWFVEKDKLQQTRFFLLAELGVRKAIDISLLQHFRGEQRDNPNSRADSERGDCVAHLQLVVIEVVALVPEASL
jgi:hypothetical protein